MIEIHKENIKETEFYLLHLTQKHSDKRKRKGEEGTNRGLILCRDIHLGRMLDGKEGALTKSRGGGQ